SSLTAMTSGTASSLHYHQNRRGGG
ncbi:hypothetical protein CSUI_010064, partial [Cystoisospora suis]